MILNITKTKPTFICGHRASGGGLFCSLLDFHPELLVYPDESKFFYLFYPIMDNEKISTEKKINCMRERILEFTRGILIDKCKATTDHFNFEVFIKDYNHMAQGKSEWWDHLKALIQAFSNSSPQPKDQIKRWVERTTCSEIYAHSIIKAFPECKFIHNVRDPRDNYASMKSRWDKKLRFLSDSTSLEALIQTCIERSRLGLEMGILNQKLYGKNKYMFSRYEDLVTDNETTLNKVADFLDISKTKYTGRPSFCGLTWEGNNFDNKKFKDVSSVQVGRWKERIDDHEAALIEFHFRELMQYFDYKSEFSELEQNKAASKHYKWLNYSSNRKADFSLATKVKF